MKIGPWISAAVMILASALPTLAEETARINNNTQPLPVWQPAVFAFILVLGVAAAGFMTPKRGHKD